MLRSDVDELFPDFPEPEDQGQEETKREVIEERGCESHRKDLEEIVKLRESQIARGNIGRLFNGIKDSAYFTARGFVHYVLNSLRYTKDSDECERELIRILAQILRERRP